MKWVDELHRALDEITYDPILTRNQWREAIDTKVKELVERYREEHVRESTDHCVPSSDMQSYPRTDYVDRSGQRNAG